MRTPLTPRLLLLFLLALAAPACIDVRSFAGPWQGAIVPDEPLRQGFGPEVRVDELLLANVDLRGITAVLTTSDGRFQQSRLQPVQKFANDPLATLTFDGAPLRSYLLFATPTSEPQGTAVWLLVSFFSDDHVELRAIRGNELFGLFPLTRKE